MPVTEKFREGGYNPKGPPYGWSFTDKLPEKGDIPLPLTDENQKLFSRKKQCPLAFSIQI